MFDRNLRQNASQAARNTFRREGGGGLGGQPNRDDGSGKVVSLRLFQLKLIGSIMGIRSLMVVAPPGSGKSLPFLVAAYVLKKVTFVSAPLEAICLFQVKEWTSRGFPFCLFENLQDHIRQYHSLPFVCTWVCLKLYQASPWYDVGYLSPEDMVMTGPNCRGPLLHSVINMYLEQDKIALFVVDEGHLTPAWFVKY